MGVALTATRAGVLARVLGALHAAVHEDAVVTSHVGAVTLHPHQREAVAILLPELRHHGGALLADPVGTGKTWSALGVATHYGRLLVVAPAALRSMWTDALARAGMRAPILTFEALSRGVQPHDVFDLVIVDEAHHVRNPATQRFKALANTAWGADVLFLSATPLHNSEADLRALWSLFLGSGASSVDADALSRLICRRALRDLAMILPRMGTLAWLPVADSSDVLQTLLALPPPLTPADGGAAAALGTCVLVRQWCSSDAALIAALDRRLMTGAAMAHRLSQGRLPTRRELLTWMADAGAVQLTLSLDADEPVTAIENAASQLDVHLQAVRSLRDTVRSDPARDECRFALLVTTLAQHSGERVVLFTHSVDTARMWFRRLSPRFRVACLDGRGGRVVSGRLSREEIVRAFRPAPGSGNDRSHDRIDPMRIDLLIATDVLSEGVDLHDAVVVVHLDLPWTVARLDQRVGRLRRIGSPHAEVRRYAFEPPVAGNESLRLLERLATKAGLADSLVGVTTESFGRLERSTAQCVTSPADARDALRSLTRAWRPPDVLCEPRSHSLTAAVRSAHGESGLLVAVRLNDERMLVGVLNGEVVLDPVRILQLAHGVTRTTLPIPNHIVRQCRARVEEWIETQRAREALLLEAIRRSEAHRRVLRLLHASLRGTGRIGRAELLPVASELRALVLRSTGIGAEAAMSDWLGSHPRPGPADLMVLSDLLRPRARRPKCSHVPDGLLAILALVPE